MVLTINHKEKFFSKVERKKQSCIAVDVLNGDGEIAN